MVIRIRSAHLACLALFFASTVNAQDNGTSNRFDYTVALAGLPLARAEFSTTITEKLYRIDGNLQTTGLAKFIADTRANITASGSALQTAFQSHHFFLQYSYGKKHRSFDTKFEKGKVISARIEPVPPQKNSKNWIPVKPEHLATVVDPVSALVVPTSSDPCKGRLQLFDGESRYDLIMSRKTEADYDSAGYKGPVVVCNLKYEPISGFKKKSKDVDYVRNLKDVEIRFAKSPSLNVYAPVNLSVPTKYGVLTITATRFDG